jgi:protein-tyrosine kinase
MSRFEKAHEKARSAPTPRDGRSFDVMLPEEAPPADVFEAPWTVRESSPAARVLARTGRGRQAATAEPPPLRVHPALNDKIVADDGMPKSVAEQYRKLAGSLHQWQLEHGGKVVSVVSAVSNEGKTLTALNLALTLSGSYQRRVLLLDCDLRRPKLHEAVRVSGGPGVADAAASGLPVSPIQVTTRLALVPAGRSSADPVGALTSPGVIALLEQSRDAYDWIVLDTPPAAVLPDAGLLNEQVDGAVLVVAAGRTDFDMVSRAVATIGRDRILGVVLNGVDARDMTEADYHEYHSQR